MAQAVKSDAVRKFEELSERHTLLSNLYSRLASQQQLADNLETYGAKLEDVKSAMQRIARQIIELEKTAPPVLEGAITRVRV